MDDLDYSPVAVADDEEEQLRKKQNPYDSAPPIRPSAAPYEINQPGDVTPGIGRARGEIASQAPQLGGPSFPEPPPITAPSQSPVAPRPAQEAYETLRAKGPAWQREGTGGKILDVLGNATAVGREIEKGTGLGSLGYQSQLATARTAADEEAKRAQEQTRTEQADLVPMKVPWSDQPIYVQRKDMGAIQRQIGQGATTEKVTGAKTSSAEKIATGKETSAADIATGHEASAERIADKKVQNQRQPIRVMGDRTYERTPEGTWKDIGKAPPRAEPGNYSPVNDEQGATVGWVDPKSGRMVHVNEISGMNEQVAPGGAIPPKPGQMQQSRAAQATTIDRAANNLIDTLNTHRDKVGNVKAIIESAFLGTPLSDPDQAGVATELASFAALQPAMHGFRGTDALREFEKVIGGIPKDADALIASIKAIQRTAGAVNPKLAEPQRPPNVPKEAVYNKQTRTWQMPQPKP